MGTVVTNHLDLFKVTCSKLSWIQSPQQVWSSLIITECSLRVLEKHKFTEEQRPKHLSIWPCVLHLVKIIGFFYIHSLTEISPSRTNSLSWEVLIISTRRQCQTGLTKMTKEWPKPKPSHAFLTQYSNVITIVVWKNFERCTFLYMPSLTNLQYLLYCWDKFLD